MDSWTKFLNGSMWSHPIFNFVTKNSFSCSPSLSFLECGTATSTGLCTSDQGISWSPFGTSAQLRALTCQELERCEYSPCPPHKLTLGCLWNASEGGREGGRGRQREAGREGNGLVDAHTHPVWVGDRVHEFAMKVRSHFEECTPLTLVK